MTQVSLCFLFVLGLGEGQCKTETDAGFSGCQPKEVGRVAPKKTTGLCCLPSPCQSCGSRGGQTVNHPEPLCHPMAWRVIYISALVETHHSVHSAWTVLKSWLYQEAHKKVCLAAEEQRLKDGGGQRIWPSTFCPEYILLDLDPQTWRPSAPLLLSWKDNHRGESVTVAASCMALFCSEHFLSLQLLLKQAFTPDRPKNTDVLFLILLH